SDACKEVALGVSSKLIWTYILNAPLIHVALRYQASSHQLPKPSGGIAVEVVVVDGGHLRLLLHHPNRRRLGLRSTVAQLNLAGNATHHDDTVQHVITSSLYPASRMGTLKPHHARHITGMTVPHASQRTPKPVLPVFLSAICPLRHGAPQEQPLPTSSSMMRASRPAHDEAVSLPVSRYTVFATRSACSPITIASRISPAPHGHAHDAAPARWGGTTQPITTAAPSAQAAPRWPAA